MLKFVICEIQIMIKKKKKKITIRKNNVKYYNDKSFVRTPILLIQVAFKNLLKYLQF